VHAVRAVKPVVGLSRESRNSAMQEILYADDMLWNDSTQVAFDPHRVAWLAEDDLPLLAPHLSGRPPTPAETIIVSYPDPEHAVLDAQLDSPGLVILCDVYYPGWALTFDQMPATIFRVNGVMRGASVPAGKHRLVYSYAPRSFLAGGVISIVGVALLTVLGLFCVLRPVDRVLGPADEPAIEPESVAPASV
jgi:hypothetical protein